MLFDIKQHIILSYELLKMRFLTLLGDIQYHRSFPYLILAPEGYGVKGFDFEEIQKQIQPYDVLLRRYDRYVGSGFIPGYWNHAGVVDTEGKILHAIAEGVVKDYLFDFSKTDHICLLRPNFSFHKEIIEERLRRFPGRNYDFDFNFRDGSRLSCTELVYELFRGYDHKIPLSKVDYVFFEKEIVIPDTIFLANFTCVYRSK